MKLLKDIIKISKEIMFSTGMECINQETHGRMVQSILHSVQ